MILATAWTAASAQDVNPAPCFRENSPEGLNSALIDQLIVDRAAGRGFNAKKLMQDRASVLIAKCAPNTALGDQAQLDILVQGLLAVLMRDEAASRLAAIGFDTGRIDQLFAPYLNDTPLEQLSPSSLQLPPEVRGEARQMLQDAAEKSGVEGRTVAVLFSAYLIGLIGDVALERRFGASDQPASK